MTTTKISALLVALHVTLAIAQPVHAAPIEIGGPWQEFSISSDGVSAIGCGPAYCQPSSSGNSVFAVHPPWTFVAPPQGVDFTITDAYGREELFHVFDFGQLLGVTPAPSGVGFCGGALDLSSDPDVRLTDPQVSHSVFRLDEGAHSITIVPYRTIGTTAAYFRVDPVPEPSTTILLLLGSAGAGAAIRRRVKVRSSRE